MAATADLSTKRRNAEYASYPVADATVIYAGTLVALDATGYAEPATDASNKTFVGVASEWVDNSEGDDGDLNVTVWRKFAFCLEAGTGFTPGVDDIGKKLYAVDDSTVGLSDDVSNYLYVGDMMGIDDEDTTHVWVDIIPGTFHIADSHLIDGTDAHAASAISVTDSGDILAADNVEDALAEIAGEVDTHVADASDAHDASAVSVADSGGYTDETDVESALQEIYNHLLNAEGFINVPLATLVETDGTNTVAYLGPSTTPILDLANGDTDSALSVTWAATDVDAVVFQTALPPDLNAGSDIVIHLRAAAGGATDTIALNADTYFNEGDTKVEDSVNVSGTSYAEKTITIAAADVPSGAQTMTVELTPGTHGNDSLIVTAIWIEYSRSLLTA